MYPEGRHFYPRSQDILTNIIGRVIIITSQKILVHTEMCSCDKKLAEATHSKNILGDFKLELSDGNLIYLKK